MPMPTQDSPAVALCGVTKHFAARDRRGPPAPAVLEHVDLTVAPGEFLTLLGASGCGKTTLLRLLAGLEQPTSGEIRVFGQVPADACRRRSVGVAFQQPALVPSRTALENVRLTLEITGAKAGGGQPNADPGQLLAEFGLGQFLHHYPHQLSGGMRQRVNIACALVHAPGLLLLDEPFGALDELTRASMMDWLAGILARTGQTVLLVTHSVEEAVCLSDRVAILSRRPGRIAQILPIPLCRPRPEAFRATTAFLEVAAQTRLALRRILGAETEDAAGGDALRDGRIPVTPIAAGDAIEPMRGALAGFEPPISPPTLA
jgi:NitT/TauT family transport system ATP-binding protein